VVENEGSKKMTRTSVTRKRRQLARNFERATVAERPFIGRGPRYIVQPSVTAACAPSLRAIAAALRDENLAIDSDQLQTLQTFIRGGGSDSPFFGDDATEALREAVRLQHDIVGAVAAPPEYEPDTVAA